MSVIAKNPMTIAMLAIFLIMVGIASTYPPGARFMPFVVGVPAIMLCLLQMVLDARNARQAPEPKDRRSEMEIAEERVSQMTGRQLTFEAVHLAPEITVSENPTGVRESSEWRIWGYVLALIAGLLFFGYMATIPIFLLLFLRWQARCSWARAATYAAIGASTLYLIFIYTLRFQFHQGFITEWMMGFLG